MIGDLNLPPQITRSLVWAAIFEAICIIAGIAAWLVTANWSWIVIGLVASLGFSLPAVIKLIRWKEENDHAPR